MGVNQVKCPKCGAVYRKTVKNEEKLKVLCPFCLEWGEVTKENVVV